MTDNRDELLVRRFFDENRIVVPDNGFSHRVMRRVPDKTRHISRIWTAICSVVAILFFIRNDVFTMLYGTLIGSASDIMTNDAVQQSPLLIVISIVAFLVMGLYRLIAEEE